MSINVRSRLKPLPKPKRDERIITLYALNRAGNESGHVEHKKRPRRDEKRKTRNRRQLERKRKKRWRARKKRTPEQRRLDMISMECLLTLIHGLGPTDK